MNFFFNVVKNLKKLKNYIVPFGGCGVVAVALMVSETIFLSINPKHDIKLFCRFTQIAHKLSTNCTWGQFLFKVCFILRLFVVNFWFNWEAYASLATFVPDVVQQHFLKRNIWTFFSMFYNIGFFFQCSTTLEFFFNVLQH